MKTPIEIEGVEGPMPDFFISEKRGLVVSVINAKQQVPALCVMFTDTIGTNGTKVALFGGN